MRRAIAALAVAAGALVAASAIGAKDEPLGASVCGASGCTAVGPDDALTLLRALWQLPLGAAPARPAPFFRISFVYPQDSPFAAAPAYFVPDSGALRVRDAETIGRWSRGPAELIARLSALTAALRPFALPRVTRAEVDIRLAAGPQTYLLLYELEARGPAPVDPAGPPPSFGTPEHPLTVDVGRYLDRVRRTWIPVHLSSATPSPWTDDASFLWVSRRGNLVKRDGEVIRISARLAERIRRRLPLP